MQRSMLKLLRSSSAALKRSFSVRLSIKPRRFDSKFFIEINYMLRSRRIASIYYDKTDPLDLEDILTRKVREWKLPSGT